MVINIVIDLPAVVFVVQLRNLPGQFINLLIRVWSAASPERDTAQGGTCRGRNRQQCRQQ